MKLILEFDSYQEMVAYCQRVVGSEAAPSGKRPTSEEIMEEVDKEKAKKEAAAAKRKAAAAKKKAEEEAAAAAEETSDETSEGTEVEVEISMADIEIEVDRIRALGRAATLKIRKYLDDNGIDRIGDMDPSGYADLHSFLVGVKK